MRSTLSRDCRRTREALQDCLDLREAPPASVLGHISGCRDCQRFQASLLRLSMDLRPAVEAPVAARADDTITIDAMSLSPPRGLRSWPGWRWTVGAVAAALVIALGTGFALRLHAAAMERAAVREDMALLVRDLYRQSALDGVEYAPVTVLDDVTSLSDWLSTSAQGSSGSSDTGP